MTKTKNIRCLSICSIHHEAYISQFVRYFRPHVFCYDFFDIRCCLSNCYRTKISKWSRGSFTFELLKDLFMSWLTAMGCHWWRQISVLIAVTIFTSFGHQWMRLFIECVPAWATQSLTNVIQTLLNLLNHLNFHTVVVLYIRDVQSLDFYLWFVYYLSGVLVFLLPTYLKIPEASTVLTNNIIMIYMQVPKNVMYCGNWLLQKGGI